jgi:hypothetical protein
MHTQPSTARLKISSGEDAVLVFPPVGSLRASGSPLIPIGRECDWNTGMRIKYDTNQTHIDGFKR